MSDPPYHIPERGSRMSIQANVHVPNIESTDTTPDTKPVAQLPTIKPTIQVPQPPQPISNTPHRTFEETIDIFIGNWYSATENPPKKTIRPRAINDPLKEWNPAQEGHLLTELDVSNIVPTQMFLDCIFDPHHFENEDITDIKEHKDPLIEEYLVLARVEMMAAVRSRWRILRENDDQKLQAHLDLLSNLYSEDVITPFPPLAKYLDSWIAWRKRGEGHIHSRPMIHKDDKWVSRLGARLLGGEAEKKIVERVKVKTGDLWLAWEDDVEKLLSGVKKDVEDLMNARGSPFVLDIEGLERVCGSSQGVADDVVDEGVDGES